MSEGKSETLLRKSAIVRHSESVLSNRLALINVEETVNRMSGGKAQYRCWPPQSILYVGTVAQEAGWDVVLHDELVGGYVNLKKMVKPGDVVGLSLVVTGIERGIQLARAAKKLGAKYVIAGNDAAILRARELLSLSDTPIDAVFTGSTLTPIREFLTQIEYRDISELNIPGVAVVPPLENRSNEHDVLAAEQKMRLELGRRGEYNPRDFFIVPNLNLYPREYWETVWKNWRQTFGKTVQNAKDVRPGLALFAQGCTRTEGKWACEYCTIPDVAHIAQAPKEHLEKLLKAYSDFGINYVFNVTDSSYEMEHTLRHLEELDAHFSKGLVLYGRAQGIAENPELLTRWRALVGKKGKLVLNVGMDSGSAQLLENVRKAEDTSGALLLEQNYRAVDAIAATDGVYLHMSLICGIPGEDAGTWEESLALLTYARTKLGKRLLQAESDIFWLNFGSAAGAVFHSYEKAVEYAALAGKTISENEWRREFYVHRNEISVPQSAQKAYYRFFTNLTYHKARKNVREMAKSMRTHKGAAPGRRSAFKPG